MLLTWCLRIHSIYTEFILVSYSNIHIFFLNNAMKLGNAWTDQMCILNAILGIVHTECVSIPLRCSSIVFQCKHALDVRVWPSRWCLTHDTAFFPSRFKQQKLILCEPLPNAYMQNVKLLSSVAFFNKLRTLRKETWKSLHHMHLVCRCSSITFH